MEEKTGCVRRDMECRKAMRKVSSAAQQLVAYEDSFVSDLAAEILKTAQALEE